MSADDDVSLVNTQPMEPSSQSQPLQSSPETDPAFWGNLGPIKKAADDADQSKKLIFMNKCPTFWMDKDVNKIGRLPSCTIQLTSNFIRNSWLDKLSKVHFEITRELVNPPEDYVVFLTDRSQNGTYVNGNLVGRGNKVVLDDEDTIALCRSDIGIFKFNYRNYEKKDPNLQDNYVALRSIGAGACGQVYLAYSKGSFGKCAIKIIRKNSRSLTGPRVLAKDAGRVMNEVRIMRAVNNPFTIKMLDVLDTPDKLYITLELMQGGELFEHIRQKMRLPEDQAKFIFFQIISAVNYLHKNFITHRDLKLENVLLVSKCDYPHIKVSDFGLSKLVHEETHLKTFCGTLVYIAPEIIKSAGKGEYTNKVDIWSLGVILYAMFSGRLPFYDNNPNMKLKDQILSGAYCLPSLLFGGVSEKAKSMIRGMLEVNPERRRDITSVYFDDWFRDRAMQRRISALFPKSGENADPNSPTAKRPRLELPPTDWS